MPQAPCDNGDMTIRDELLLPWPRTQRDIRTYRARYWTMITHHDRQIGHVLRYLEETGQRDETLIVFTGDHGLAVGSHGLFGKENMYDHSCRIPCVMTGPGIPAGRTFDDQVTNCDLYPTPCEACDLSSPANVQDGRSLAPFFINGEGSGRDFTVSAFQSPDPTTREIRNTQRAIRTAEWKMIYYPLTQRYELYHLEGDPLELNNLLDPWKLREAPLWSYAPSYGSDTVYPRARQLRDALIAWQKDNNDDAWMQIVACPLR